LNVSVIGLVAVTVYMTFSVLTALSFFRTAAEATILTTTPTPAGFDVPFAMVADVSLSFLFVLASTVIFADAAGTQSPPPAVPAGPHTSPKLLMLDGLATLSAVVPTARRKNSFVCAAAGPV
jgi:hypothetical protein